MPSPFNTTAKLVCHPLSPMPAVTALHANVTSDSRGLRIEYTLEADLATLLLPAQTQSGFADELWRHTCFEAFIATPDSSRYREFNFAPDGRWAAYAFADYRQRDTDWQPAASPEITTQTTADRFALQATIPASLLPEGDALIGLTAVIEARDGMLAYWALKHCSERPDFHTRAAFTLRLPATKQSS